MKQVRRILRGNWRLRRIRDVSKEASMRLKWFDYYFANGQNARLACRHFDISPQTFYRWKRRYDSEHLDSLEDLSHRPRKIRQPTYSVELVETVIKLRETYPRWGKEKLAILLAAGGHRVSASTVGRILSRAKERGFLKEPIPNYVSARKRSRNRPYAVRKPKDYQATAPGDIIQLDTMDLRPLPGVIMKHYTAHDVVSKWNVLAVHYQASAATTAHFLDSLAARMPFGIKAIQVDGGSEFESVFEQECQRRGIKLFVLPPRSPKLNGGVERANRTHAEEFYELTDSTYELADIREELLQWETVHNNTRPHQALGYLTPQQYLQQRQIKEVGCH